MMIKRDFESLSVVLEVKKSPFGVEFAILRFSGRFWGFEKDEEGNIEDYLLKVCTRFNRIVVDLSILELYSDNGPVLIRAAKKYLAKKNGKLVIFCPGHSMAYSVAEFIHGKDECLSTEEEAIITLEI